jgi:hypothetical protein
MRTIALAGHNVITLEQAARARDGVRAVLEALAARRVDGERWRFLTPLAPGSDYVLTRTAIDWLEARGDACELHVCQHVALDVLVRAWVEQRGAERGTPDGEPGAKDEGQVLAQLEALRARARLVHPPGAPDLEAALARNDAYLLQHADELIVALDSARFGSRRGAFMDAPLEALPRLGTAHLARTWLATEPARANRLHIIELGSL